MAQIQRDMLASQAIQEARDRLRSSRPTERQPAWPGNRFTKWHQETSGRGGDFGFYHDIRILIGAIGVENPDISADYEAGGANLDALIGDDGQLNGLGLEIQRIGAAITAYEVGYYQAVLLDDTDADEPTPGLPFAEQPHELYVTAEEQLALL